MRGRHEILRLMGRVVAGIILSIAPNAARGADAPDKRPNILFCIADDWSWPHAGAYGDPVVKTPTFDRVVREGVLFTQAFCAAPSCTPSRAAILTGRYPHQLDEGGNLWSTLSTKYPTYTRLLEEAGYHVGSTRKGWGPGNFKAGGYEQNPAGKPYKGFDEFMAARAEGQPFCFWFGSQDPHRTYEPGSGIASGMDPSKVIVPPIFPDTPEVRSDICDYYFEVQRFDREVGEMIKLLEERGLLDSTLVVITSDNGMPFPRCKTNLYDSGTRMPLAMRFPGRQAAGHVEHSLCNHVDLASLFLQFADIEVPASMKNGGSYLAMLKAHAIDKLGSIAPAPYVFVERERHANVRKGDLSYPVRAVRGGWLSPNFMYIRNFRPDLWPAGDPEMYQSVGDYGDIDNSPTKSVIIDGRDKYPRLFELSCGKRPAEELYDLDKDPWQMNNLADDPKHATVKKNLRVALDRWMEQTGDRRASGDTDYYDKLPYYGEMKRNQFKQQR